MKVAEHPLFVLLVGKGVIKLTKGTKSFPIGRNAETGKLVPVDYAREHPKTHVVERMPKPGRGDSN